MLCRHIPEYKVGVEEMYHILSQVVHGRILKINNHNSNALGIFRHKIVDGPMFQEIHKYLWFPYVKITFLHAKKMKYNTMHLKT